uniref:Sushi domain-containing protein n=1 Tax=Accipiter nisus TaxID=211598 RepID=A0A8B9NDQ0_9AVES
AIHRCSKVSPLLLSGSPSGSSCQHCCLCLPDFPAVKCLHPPNITNGKLKGNISDTFSYGASVSYSCNPGYSLIGNAFINCTVSGTWSQPHPQCKGVFVLKVQGVKKAIKGNTYRSGTNITLECESGYTLEGISQIQCQEDFSWDPPVPKPCIVGLSSKSFIVSSFADFSFSLPFTAQRRWHHFPLLTLQMCLVMSFVLICFKTYSENNTCFSLSGVAAAGVLLLLGAGIVWKIISKQKQG